MAASSKRALKRTNPALAHFTYHPTKGYRRVSLRRVAAQLRMPRVRLTMALLGAAVQ